MFDGVPEFAIESLRKAEFLLTKAVEADDESREDYLRMKAEEAFDWAAFGGVSRSYIDCVRSHYLI